MPLLSPSLRYVDRFENDAEAEDHEIRDLHSLYDQMGRSCLHRSGALPAHVTTLISENRVRLACRLVLESVCFAIHHILTIPTKNQVAGATLERHGLCG